VATSALGSGSGTEQEHPRWLLAATPNSWLNHAASTLQWMVAPTEIYFGCAQGRERANFAGLDVHQILFDGARQMAIEFFLCSDNRVSQLHRRTHWRPRWHHRRLACVGDLSGPKAQESLPPQKGQLGQLEQLGQMREQLTLDRIDRRLRPRLCRYRSQARRLDDGNAMEEAFAQNEWRTQCRVTGSISHSAPRPAAVSINRGQATSSTKILAWTIFPGWLAQCWIWTTGDGEMGDW